MKQSLKHVQIIYKVGKIFTLILMILTIVGLVGALVGGISLLVMPSLDQMELAGWMEEDLPSDYEMSKLGLSLLAQTVILAGQAVIYFFQNRYFTNELSDGTPFTRRGVHEMVVVGIVTMTVSVGAVVIAAIVLAIGDASQYLEKSNGAMLTEGLVFLLLSVIFRYATELEEARGASAAVEEAEERELI